jgi:BON domain-containing protein
MTTAMSMRRRVMLAISPRRFDTRLMRVRRAATGWVPAVPMRRVPAGRTAMLLAAFGLGALAEYFVLDHRHAARRRHAARERGLAVLRRRSRAAMRRAKYLEGIAQGVAYKTAHTMPGVRWHEGQPDDVTLAHKVESIAFRKARVPKERVNVNAANGVVSLRGRLERNEQITQLVRATEAIDGVRKVNNLLHAPGATRPARQPPATGS